ncbi:hypothetical protein [Acidisoma sp. C75]
MFLARAGLFLHRSLLNTAPAPDRLSVVGIGGASVKLNALSVTVPGDAYDVTIRLRREDMGRPPGSRRRHSPGSGLHGCFRRPRPI